MRGGPGRRSGAASPRPPPPRGSERRRPGNRGPRSCPPGSGRHPALFVGAREPVPGGRRRLAPELPPEQAPTARWPERWRHPPPDSGNLHGPRQLSASVGDESCAGPWLELSAPRYRAGRATVPAQGHLLGDGLIAPSATTTLPHPPGGAGRLEHQSFRQLGRIPSAPDGRPGEEVVERVEEAPEGRPRRPPRGERSLPRTAGPTRLDAGPALPSPDPGQRARGGGAAGTSPPEPVAMTWGLAGPRPLAPSAAPRRRAAVVAAPVLHRRGGDPSTPPCATTPVNYLTGLSTAAPTSRTTKPRRSPEGRRYAAASTISSPGSPARATTSAGSSAPSIATTRPPGRT
jgi:hypothetical protein